MKQKEKIAKTATDVQKINEDLNNLHLKIESWIKRLCFIKSLTIALIGFFGAIITLYIDNIKQGTMNLPSEWGFMQVIGLIIFLLIFFWGVLLVVRKK